MNSKTKKFCSTALGAIGVARIVPLVLLALGSGVLADALDRRKLMLFSQTAMMLCSAALAIASSLGIVTVWWIYIVTALSSAAAASRRSRSCAPRPRYASPRGRRSSRWGSYSTASASR